MERQEEGLTAHGRTLIDKPLGEYVTAGLLRLGRYESGGLNRVTIRTGGLGGVLCGGLI